MAFHRTFGSPSGPGRPRPLASTASSSAFCCCCTFLCCCLSPCALHILLHLRQSLRNHHPHSEPGCHTQFPSLCCTVGWAPYCTLARSLLCTAAQERWSTPALALCDTPACSLWSIPSCSLYCTVCPGPCDTLGSSLKVLPCD